MSLILAFHGGKCCGIKTIYGFPVKPYPIEEYKEPKLSKRPRLNHDRNGDEVRSDLNFFTDDAPFETTEDRLKRYIEFVKKHRPDSIIEITLAESPNPYMDQSAWFPVLRKLRFRRVNRHKNSNSGNIVRVYHLNVGERV